VTPVEQTPPLTARTAFLTSICLNRAAGSLECLAGTQGGTLEVPDRQFHGILETETTFEKIVEQLRRYRAVGRLSAAILLSLTAGITAAGCGSTSQETPPHLTSIEDLRQIQERADTEALKKTGQVKLWGLSRILPSVPGPGVPLFSDSFDNLSNWHHEGLGSMTQPEPNLMQLNCTGSAQGGTGCMAFCKEDFPDSILIGFDLRVLTTNGLLIAFVASRGRQGEDMLAGLPPRRGVFADYVFNPRLRSYHVSLSRYDDDGVHTGTSNWRRNPGLFLMEQQPDLCKEPRRWYHVAILKEGPLLCMAVDGSTAAGFLDHNEIPDAIPGAGKIGFRAIGRHVIVQIRNFTVSRTEHWQSRQPTSPSTGKNRGRSS